MSDQVIQRSALVFMVAVGAVTANLWAQHEHAPAQQRTADTTLAQWLAGKDARVSDLIGATIVDNAGDSIGEIKDFVVSKGEQGTRAVVGLGKEAGAAEGRLVAVPLDALHLEGSGEEARAVPQHARVRVELNGTTIEALPAYEYPTRDVI